MSPEPVSWFTEEADLHQHHKFAYKRVLYSGETEFQRVEILETLTLGKMLILDGAVQSAQGDECIYHESLIHPAMMTHPDPKNILIVGGGEGASLREVLQYRSVKKATMVELDPDVVRLAREFLPEWHRGAFDDPRTRMVFGDGRAFVRDTDEIFDVIVIDVTDSIREGPARALYTQEFYRLLESRLTPAGLVVVQGLELTPLAYRDHTVLCRTLESVFPIVRSYKTFIPAFWTDWAFVLASKQADPTAIPTDVLERRLAGRLRRNSLDGALRFYDPHIHHKLFHLPESLRAAMRNVQEVLTEPDSPVQGALNVG